MDNSIQKGTTIYDIAEKTGLSAATVSRVLNGKDNISEKTRNKVMAAAKELHYVTNTFARSLKTKKTEQIIISIPDQSNPFYFDMIDQIHKQAKLNGYSVLLNLTESNEKEELKILKKMKNNLADALIMVTVNITDELVKEAKNSDHPVVLSGICLNTRDMSEVTYDYVGVDTYRGVYIAAQHLIENGHKNIGYIGLSVDSQPGHQRYQGFCDALNHAGLRIEHNHVVLGGITEEFGYLAAKQLLQAGSHPSALCTSSDIIALGVYRALKEDKVKVPDEISIVSMDNTEICAHIYPSLSSVAVYEGEIGRTAAEIIFRRLKGFDGEFQNIVFQPKLIIRESSDQKKQQ